MQKYIEISLEICEMCNKTKLQLVHVHTNTIVFIIYLYRYLTGDPEQVTSNNAELSSSSFQSV